MQCFIFRSTLLFRMQIEQLRPDNSFYPKMTTFKQVTSDPLQEHEEICYWKTVSCIVAGE